VRGKKELHPYNIFLVLHKISIQSLEGVIVSYQAQKALNTYVLFFNGHNE
jgi:hypothetical protein